MGRKMPFSRGFTIVELLIASSVSVVLFAVMYQLLLTTANLTDMMISRVTLNQEAREAFRMLRDGGGVDVDLSGDLTDAEVVPGLHGTSDVSLYPYTASITRVGQRLKIRNVATSRSIFSGETTVDITCTAAGTPHPDCAAAGTLNVDGVMSVDPAIASVNTLSVVRCDNISGTAPNTVIAASVSLTLTDPRLMFETDEFIQTDYQSGYRTIVANLVDCAG